MVTDQCTGRRSIQPARETYAVVAFVSLSVATVLRCVYDLPGAAAGVLLTLVALAFLSRFRVSWDKDGIACHNPFWTTRKRWSELSAFSIEPLAADVPVAEFGGRRRSPMVFQGSRLLLHGAHRSLTIGLLPYSWQDTRHLVDAVTRELPVRENAAALVS